MENMIVINNRQYMGIDEAAKSLGVSVHHVRREMYRNNIRYFRHAKKILFLPGNLIRAGANIKACRCL